MSSTDWDRICQWCQGDMDYGCFDFCSDECRGKSEMAVPCRFCGALNPIPGEACSDRCDAAFRSLSEPPHG